MLDYPVDSQEFILSFSRNHPLSIKALFYPKIVFQGITKGSTTTHTIKVIAIPFG